MDRQPNRQPGSNDPGTCGAWSLEDLAKARERERRNEPGKALRRAQVILREHSLDPATWGNLLRIYETFGRKGAAGYLRGLAVPLSAIGPIVTALPTRAAIDKCIIDRLGL